MSNFSTNKNRPSWLLIVIIFVLTVSISALAYFYYAAQVNHTRELFAQELTSLAELKIGKINLWRAERLVDGERIRTDARISRSIEALINSPDDPEMLIENREWMKNQFNNPNYFTGYLLDGTGTTILQVGEEKEELGEYGKQIALKSILSHEIVLTDLHAAADGSIHLDLSIPIVKPGGENKPALAVIVVHIDPYITFFSLVQSWPTARETAETLLVRREGDEVVYLNELRYQKNTAFKLRFPITNQTLPASMAARGVTGIVEGIDYRGVPVIAAIVPVEGTDWKMIAKIDRSEIYAPLRSQGWTMGLTLLFLLLAGGLSLSALWRRQSAKNYKGLFEAELERKTLEERYKTLFNQANDAILLIDDKGKIIDTNEQAGRMYGYTRDELLTLSIADLRDPSTQSQIPVDMESVRNGAGTIFESIHRRKNGELFQVDVSSRHQSVEGKGIFQSIIRDVTERKRAEEQLRRSEIDLKKAQQVSHVGSWIWNMENNKLEWSDEMYRIFGIEKENFSGNLADAIASAIHPDDHAAVEASNLSVIKEKKPVPMEYRVIWPDKSVHVVWAEAGELILDENGNPKSLSGIVQDITEKKAAENELRRRENLLTRIYEILPVGLWITDKTGRLIRSNRMIKQIWGEDLRVSQDEFEVFRGRRLPSRELIKPDDWASVHTIKEGVTIKDELIEIDAYDGKTKTILNYSTPILDENGGLEGAIVVNLDITELKKAEEQLSAQLDELQRWNLATLGRENRILELKKEVNECLRQQGKPPKYQSAAEEIHD